MAGMLTCEEVEDRLVALLRGTSDDKDARTIRALSLRDDVLKAIAEGRAEDPQRLAELALRTIDPILRDLQ